MSTKRDRVTENLTLLIFKDNYTARTFKIPLSWVSRFGFLLGILTGLTLLSSILAFKYFRTARHLDPSRVLTLEQELADLKASKRTLESGWNSEISKRQDSNAPTSSPALPPPPTAETPTSSASKDAFLFTGLPSGIQLLAPSDTSSVEVFSPKAFWTGKTLKVRFALQYTRKDQGAQQGRIIVLARGPGTLLTHPRNVLNASMSESLIAPEQGEYFSVGHFREAAAEFGPVYSPDALKEVEIIILSSTKVLLAHQIISPGSESEDP